MTTRLHLNPNSNLSIARGIFLTNEKVATAVSHCNEICRKLHTLPIELFQLLGMRNLSSFVGELFAASLRETTGVLFKKNPHQDGYPDLLLMDPDGTSLWGTLALKLRDKLPFSPYATGGIEVKATCGSVPTDAACRKRGYPGKPHIGEQRIELLSGYDWKAHHRETNHLMGIFWDFIDKAPQIMAVFYCNTLVADDWSPIIQPKEGGGRTTSVSIMTRGGVRKMYEHWVCVVDDYRYSRFFNARNGGKIMPELAPINPPSKESSLPLALHMSPQDPPAHPTLS